MLTFPERNRNYCLKRKNYKGIICYISMAHEGQITGHYRSRGEDGIAKFLKSQGIRYFYEHPFDVVDDGKAQNGCLQKCRH